MRTQILKPLLTLFIVSTFFYSHAQEQGTKELTLGYGVASTNAIRVASLLPTTVAYPQYTYLHPALPEAGDRQIAKTYFEI